MLLVPVPADLRNVPALLKTPGVLSKIPMLPWISNSVPLCWLKIPPLIKKLLVLESTTFVPLFNVRSSRGWPPAKVNVAPAATVVVPVPPRIPLRSEEHTSQLQSPHHLVCTLLLQKIKLATLIA